MTERKNSNKNVFSFLLKKKTSLFLKNSNLKQYKPLIKMKFYQVISLIITP